MAFARCYLARTGFIWRSSDGIWRGFGLFGVCQMLFGADLDYLAFV
ncbi:hypothetical protein [Sporosarcina cyprini]|nr:hypothetical protein [Sporosarcina cyprini]MCG3089693.1 hypothetical protein [Sporosarcina cyprini]